jgi:hypothetical protein
MPVSYKRKNTMKKSKSSKGSKRVKTLKSTKTKKRLTHKSKKVSVFRKMRGGMNLIKKLFRKKSKKTVTKINVNNVIPPPQFNN